MEFFKQQLEVLAEMIDLRWSSIIEKCISHAANFGYEHTSMYVYHHAHVKCNMEVLCTNRAVSPKRMPVDRSADCLD